SQVVTRTLPINNTGLTPLTWTITERAPAQVALAGPAPARLDRGGAAQPTPAQAPAAEQVQDGGFEATVSAGTNQFWTQSSTNFSGVLCNVSRCGDGGGAGIGPRSGGWFAWFGGLDTGMATEVGTLRQSVIIPSGATTLRFWLRIAGSSQRSNDVLQVEIDSTEVVAINAQATGYGAYRLVSVPISQFANGASHQLTFRGTVQEGGNTNFLVDDVSLDPAVRSCVADALPWVRVSPASGSVAAGGSASVAVVFNSAGLAPGTYAGTLCLATNDSQQPDVSIPLTLTVRNQQDFPKLYLPLVFKP
ncbi:MAG TPA: peptidase S8, partial [Herpetosiphonaceae bacterium]